MSWLVSIAAIYGLPPCVRCFVHAISFDSHILLEMNIISPHFIDGETEVQREVYLFTQSTILIIFLLHARHRARL